MQPTSSAPGEKDASTSPHAPTKPHSIFAQNAVCGHRSGRVAVHNGVSFRVSARTATEKDCVMEFLARRARNSTDVPPVTGAAAEPAYISGRKANPAGQRSGP